MKPHRTFHRALQRGFTLLELMVALAILAVILAIGIPYMGASMYANKVTSAGQFYAEGFTLARDQARTHNSASRLVLTPNANGQTDWRVDICFPSPAAPCTANSANWSTAAAPAPRDPEGNAGFRSVSRQANTLPPSTQLAQTTQPADANSVYFTPVGWVDPMIGTPIQRIELRPTTAYADDAPQIGVALTMAGIASRCKLGSSDIHKCPPLP